MALTSNSTDNKENINFLANYLLEETRKLWSELPAWQWDREPFNQGMKQRILWKLENKEVDLSYYRAIIDEELFLLAIAADLIQYYPDDELLKEIMNISNQVFNNESSFNSEGKWEFQIGVWDDHPDYAYVGYDSKEGISQEKTLKNTSTDSSHFHRFPLWIRSFYEASPNNSNEKEFYNTIITGLEKQFFDVVIKEQLKNTPIIN